jgi:hypothetical protein
VDPHTINVFSPLIPSSKLVSLAKVAMQTINNAISVSNYSPLKQLL